MGKTYVDEQDGKDRDNGGAVMVEQKQRTYTITTTKGHEVAFRQLSKGEVERELTRFETKDA